MAGPQTILDAMYPSQEELRRETVEKLFRVLKKTGFHFSPSDEELFLVLDEAVTNAMEHGNRWDPHKEVHVVITIDDTTLRMSITDEGDGFNRTEVSRQKVLSGTLRKRGRGIGIMKRFCTLSWNRTGNRITLTFRKAS
jgi:anti-sigma regulatory factor (Ser/Thr protein kinase)